jgi:hypothetical protein
MVVEVDPQAAAWGYWPKVAPSLVVTHCLVPSKLLARAGAVLILRKLNALLV